jgi:flagellar biosynthesis protein FlhF
MQDTIFKVKTDLGSNAIILNTRKYRKGKFFGLFGKNQVEILAAVEEEDKYKNDRTVQELINLKNLVKELNQRWYSESIIDSLPEDFAIIYRHLNEQGIFNSINEKIILELKKTMIEKSEDLLMLTKKLISENIGMAKAIKPGPEQKVIAFIGPTGVGKTTTIAKLAAKFSIDEGKKVALVTTDTYRIAAVQQLKTYSDIMNIPLEVIYNEDNLSSTINKFKGYDLILLDTAGSNWNDRMQLGRLKKIIDHKIINEIHLLISLSTKYNDLKTIINQYGILKPDKLVLTKLDETLTFGSILNLKEDFDLPYSYITFGQDVPDDIQTAEPEILSRYILGDLYE